MAQIANNPQNKNAYGVIKLPKSYTIEVAQYERDKQGYSDPQNNNRLRT